MSADNWTYCPKCKSVDDAARKQAKEKAAALYGKVSCEAYVRLIEEAKATNEPETTLREDWEIGTDTGVFLVAYYCSCKVCGFEWQYRYETPVLELKETAG